MVTVTKEDMLNALAPHEQTLEPEQFESLRATIDCSFDGVGGAMPIDEAGQAMLVFGLMFTLFSQAIEVARARGAS